MWNILAKKPVVQLINTDQCQKWENRPFVHQWPEPNAVQGDSNIPKKKTKRQRTAFTTMQLKFLEKVFERFKYIDSKLRAKISSFLKISEKTVKVWFQNRRMKEKKESSEASSSSSELAHASMSQDIHLPHEPLNYLMSPYQNTLDIQNEMNYTPAGYNNNETVSNHLLLDNRASIYSLESESSENYNNGVSSPFNPDIGVFVRDICMQTESANIQQNGCCTGTQVPKNEPGSSSILQEAQHVLLELGQVETDIFSPGCHPNEQYLSHISENTNMYTHLYNYDNYYDNVYQYPENTNNDVTYYNFN